MEIDQPPSSVDRSITIGRSLMIKLVLFAGATGVISWLLIHMPAPLPSSESGTRSPDPIVVTFPEESALPTANVTAQSDTAPPAPASHITQGGSQPLTRRAAGVRPSTPSVTARIARRLDLNRATQAELERLPGIGPGLAKRILDYKRSHGRYTSVEELRDVKGIGEKRWRRLEPLLMVTAPTPAPTASSPLATTVPKREEAI
ncbi:MAG: ComEA family DNA-binding protein [Nitrospiraceae bacterium]